MPKMSRARVEERATARRRAHTGLASLSSSLGEIEGDVARLIQVIDVSIRESQRLLATLETTG
jgi:hypothetical protein